MLWRFKPKFCYLGLKTSNEFKHGMRSNAYDMTFVFAQIKSQWLKRVRAHTPEVIDDAKLRSKWSLKGNDACSLGPIKFSIYYNTGATS